MLIMLNIVIILFLLGSAAIWSTYGLFSSLLHLVLVIAAGVIALALWEPLSYWLLGRMPAYAHGLGLIAPFALSLIILRGVLDRVCRMNVQVPRLMDQIGGGVLGVLSGILAIGMFLNAANFLPMARTAFGWEPYSITQSSQVTVNDGGGLWLAVNEWSASFFSTVSNGAMRPLSGPTLGEARPDLAERAVLYRLAVDENQMRAAHPDNVKVTGLYSVPATEVALRAMVDRVAVQPFLAPSYKMPEVEPGENGTAVVAAIFEDFNNRHEDPATYGRPSEMLNIEKILEISSSDQYRFQNPTSKGNFQRFVQSIAKQKGDELIEQMKPVLKQGSRLVFVDTRWNSKPPAAYNSDGKLRLGMTQVALQTRAGDKLQPVTRPVGFSVEYSQNSGARTFNEVVASGIFTAFSPISEFSMGLAFVVPENAQVERLFIRELRFDLTELPNVDGSNNAEKTNIGEVAMIMGMPLVEVVEEGDATDPNNNNAVSEGAVAIGNSGAYAEISEQLPMQFSNTSANMQADENADPWLLISGKKEGLTRGKGGKKSTIKEIQVDEGERLVRIKLNVDQANSLYGRAIALAGQLGAIQLRDEAGNDVPIIGYAYVDANDQMELDIRVTANQRTMIAKDLPSMRPNEELYLYFRARIGRKVTTFMLGSETMQFEKPLEVTP